jgi:hypothetical protein
VPNTRGEIECLKLDHPGGAGLRPHSQHPASLLAVGQHGIERERPRLTGELENIRIGDQRHVGVDQRRSSSPLPLMTEMSRS